MSLTVEIRPITVSEYQYLRATTNWDSLNRSMIEVALKNTLFSICIMHNECIVGMGRIIGDGSIYFYIQDVIVLPDYQNTGVGSLIMKNIEKFLQSNAQENSFVGLMAAAGVSNFYEKFNYYRRPQDRPGMYKVMKKQNPKK